MVKIIIIVFAALGGIILLSAASVYFFFPGVILDVLRSSQRNAAKLEVSETNVDDFRISFLSGGEGPTIVMLHGFGADKYNWVLMARTFTRNYRVVAIDLPGFGESDRIEGALYDIATQIERLDTIINNIGLDKFHIVGNSMGGWISAGYTHAHPEKVLSLALLDSAGVDQPTPSPFYEAFLQGENQLLVKKEGDFDLLLTRTFVNPPIVPGSIKAYLTKESIKVSAFNERVGQQLLEIPFPLEPLLPEITQPAFILWGDTDKIIDVSAADVFDNLLPNSTKVVLPDTGHLPMMEKPQKTAELYLDFLRSNFSAG